MTCRPQRLRPAPPSLCRTAAGQALTLAAAMLCPYAQAAELSEADLVRQLSAAAKTSDEIDQSMAQGGTQDKAMRRPNRQGICAAPATGQGDSFKNLEVVPMAPPDAPQADLTLQFEYASYRLLPSDRQQLDLLARAMGHPALRNARFTLAGHTDTSGDANTNLALSCERALAARDYLVQRAGVAPERLSAYGFGHSQPRVQPAKSALNRRVEVRRAEGS